jgi:hypothetical protein
MVVLQPQIVILGFRCWRRGGARFPHGAAAAAGSGARAGLAGRTAVTAGPDAPAHADQLTAVCAGPLATAKTPVPAPCQSALSSDP